MSPRTIGNVRVRTGYTNRNSANAPFDPLQEYDFLLCQRAFVFDDQQVACLQQFGRAEAPCIATANQERMLECRLDATIDQTESLVLAEPYLRNASRTSRCPFKSPRREPFVLGAEWNISREARYQQ